MRVILAKNNKYKLIFAPRDVLEEDESYRQIIPYIIITDSQGKYALFQRYNGREKRLTGKYTIGIGGHIDISDICRIYQFKEKFENKEYTEDMFVKDCIIEAIKREVKEEIGYCFTFEQDFIEIGNIEINASPVDRVHYGIVYKFELNPSVLYSSITSIPSEERELICLGYFDKDYIIKQENLENWSRYVLENIL